ncbi:hypothetical protein KM043_015533 [Ampulex compressa]|nr:hypothetical protein KM043_015533 [Ampulex compressa]
MTALPGGDKVIKIAGWNDDNRSFSTADCGAHFALFKKLMKAKQRTRRERALARASARRFGIKRLSKEVGGEERRRKRDKEEHPDDVSIPLESAFKKAEGEILIRTFRPGRPNLLILLPSELIYKCKIAQCSCSNFFSVSLTIVWIRMCNYHLLFCIIHALA